MPSYEMALIFRVMERPQMIQAIKRASEAVVERGGILRSFENVGERELPYRMFKHGMRYRTGSYFLVNFDSPPNNLVGLMDHLNRDLDVIRPRVLRREIETFRPCETGPCDYGELDIVKSKTVKKNLRESILKL